MVSRGVSIAQFEIDQVHERMAGAEAAGPAWRVQFSLDVNELGPVHARLVLGGQQIAVGLWAEAPSGIATVSSLVPLLRRRLEEAGLTVAEIHFAAGRPLSAHPRAPVVSSIATPEGKETRDDGAAGTPNTHDKVPVASALRYDGSGAPRLIAKGRGPVAEAIIAKARESGVTIEEDPILAEALASVELDAEIPLALYTAVAEVISTILSARRRAG